MPSLVQVKRFSLMLEQVLYTNFLELCNADVLESLVVTESSGSMALCSNGALPRRIPAFGAITTTTVSGLPLVASTHGVDFYITPVGGRSFASELLSPYHVIIGQTSREYNMKLATMQVEQSVSRDFMLLDADPVADEPDAADAEADEPKPKRQRKQLASKKALTPKPIPGSNVNVKITIPTLVPINNDFEAHDKDAPVKLTVAQVQPQKKKRDEQEPRALSTKTQLAELSKKSGRAGAPTQKNAAWKHLTL